MMLEDKPGYKELIHLVNTLSASSENKKKSIKPEEMRRC